MIAVLIRLLTGAQARWHEGTSTAEPIPQRIYFANHVSNLDAPVIWASMPSAIRRKTRPIAARDYWEKGPVRRYLARHVFRCVLIERQKPTARQNPLAAMEAALADGSSLIIFPEGTRNLDDDAPAAEFKPGLWHLARKHPLVQLVPVYLENLNRILPKGEIILVPLLAAVSFGPPIRLEPGEDKQAFLSRARKCVLDLANRGQS